MELINIENLIILDDANIVKNIKFARNLVKKYNSEYIIFLPHEIVNFINSRTIKNFSHLSNIKNFLSDNFLCDKQIILTSNELLLVDKKLKGDVIKKIIRFLKIKKIKLDI